MRHAGVQPCFILVHPTPINLGALVPQCPLTISSVSVSLRKVYGCFLCPLCFTLLRAASLSYFLSACLRFPHRFVFSWTGSRMHCRSSDGRLLQSMQSFIPDSPRDRPRGWSARLSWAVFAPLAHSPVERSLQLEKFHPLIKNAAPVSQNVAVVFFAAVAVNRLRSGALLG